MNAFRRKTWNKKKFPLITSGLELRRNARLLRSKSFISPFSLTDLYKKWRTEEPVQLYLFQAFEERVANVSLAFDLMQDAGLPKPKARPEDIVNLDLKSTLRVLYNLFTKYKHLS